MTLPLVHHCDWASQPDIRIACDQSWTTPAWTQPELPKNVYAADNGKLYAFAYEVVTCEECRQKIAKDLEEANRIEDAEKVPAEEQARRRKRLDATITIDGHEVPLAGVDYGAADETVVQVRRGLEAWEIEMKLDPKSSKAIMSMVGFYDVVCPCCGNGRRYASYRSAKRARERMKRHVCPRGPRRLVESWGDFWK